MEGTTTSHDEVFVFPTSSAQQRLWLLDQIEPGNSAYNVPFHRRLRGAFDVRALERALSSVVERHETLRTVFDTQDGQPVQIVLPPAPVTVTVSDLSFLPVEEREAEVLRLARAETNRPFNLRTGPMLRASVLRVADEEHVLLMTAHHIAVDGWSLGVLTKELTAAYNAFARGAEPALPDLPIQYADFTLWQRDQHDGATLDAQLAYWKTQLRAPLPVLELPTDRLRRADSAHPAGRLMVHVPAETTEALLGLCREERITPFVLLLAAFHVLLYRYTGQEDVIVSSPISGRTRKEVEGLIGVFVNTLALRVDLSGHPSFRDVLARTREVVLGAMANQDLPFEKVVEAVQPRRERARNPISQTIFAMQDMVAAGQLEFGGLQVRQLQVALETAKFDLQLLMRTSADGFRGTLDFDRDLFDESTASGFLSHYVTLLGSVAADVNERIDALSLLAPERRDEILGWSEARSEYPRGASIPALFAESVATAPNAIALEQGERSMTYAELDASSDVIAAHLRAGGVAPGAMVAVSLERSFTQISAILGILKAGAAYVPLDPDYPAERLAFMLGDTNAPIVLTQRRFASAITTALETAALARTPRVVCVDGDRAGDLVLESSARGGAGDGHAATGATGATPASAAYVIYTSGSTGQPKGVVVPHRAVVRLVRNPNYVSLDAHETLLGFAPISFDASTLEIWGALLNGARLVLAPSGRVGVDELGAVVERHRVTTLWLTAALFHQVVDGGLARYRGVRQLLAGGEVLSVPHVRKALAALPGCRLINGYGPTENTTFTACHTIPHDHSGDHSVPIGRPVSNTTTYVLDAGMDLVPPGVPGELYTGGDGVALGYLHRPELTAERFVRDPFAREPDARMYRTGDIVRWRADGTIEYLGRADDQVKVRGFRIEPGEIEAALVQHADVQECAVVLRRNAGGESALVAYWVPSLEVRQREPVPRAYHSVLRTHLRALLPEFMLPASFVMMEALPLSPSGKVDRRALPLVDGTAEDVAADDYVAPRTTLEHELLHIWEQLLPKRPISIEDDFFDIGGHSLLAAQMLTEIERVRGRRLPFASLFEGATINRLAFALESAGDDAEPDLVLLQGEGTETPFAFVHGDVRGGGWYCRRLAPLLGTNVPMIVLPTLPAEGPGAPITVEDMAATHVARLRALQPTGPYRLGGFCAGGLVAFEMARQLVAVGERVERLVLIDATPRGVRFRRLAPILPLLVGRGSPEAQLTRRADLLRRLHYYRSRALHLWQASGSEKARWFTRNVARRVPYFGAALKPVPWPLAPAEFRERPATRLLMAQGRAAAAYIPRPYSGRIDVISAAGLATSGIKNPTRGWEELAPTVRGHTVASRHVALITYDLPLLAEKIRECLDD